MLSFWLNTYLSHIVFFYNRMKNKCSGRSSEMLLNFDQQGFFEKRNISNQITTFLTMLIVNRFPELSDFALPIRNRLHKNSRKHIIWILLLEHFLTFFPTKASVGSEVVMAWQTLVMTMRKITSANISGNPWIPAMSWRDWPENLAGVLSAEGLDVHHALRALPVHSHV